MKNKKGFTLVEVIGIIAILAMITIIAVPKINEYIFSKRENIFITSAKNIARELEYENIDFITFDKATLLDLDLSNISNSDYDLNESIAYIEDDEIYINLVGRGKFDGMYICGATYKDKNISVQNTKCDLSSDDLKYVIFDVDYDEFFLD